MNEYQKRMKAAFDKMEAIRKAAEGEKRAMTAEELEQRAALKTERMQLEAEREALLPKLEEVKGELAELNRIRYWTRKVIPDALLRVLDGRVSAEDAVETAVNRKELEQVVNDAEKNALRQSDDPLQTNQSAPIHFLAI